MSLVTVGDLKAYMDVSFTDTEERAALMVLEGLQAEMEAYLRRPVEIRTFRETHTVPSSYIPFSTSAPFYDYGDGDNLAGEYPDLMLEPFVLSIEHSPITEVSQLTATTRGNTPVTLEEVTNFTVRKFGIEIYSGIGADTKLDITYKAGLDGIDIPYFKLVILRAATRETQNMHDDVVGIKDLETRNVAPLETGFLQSELGLLKRWKRRRI